MANPVWKQWLPHSEDRLVFTVESAVSAGKAFRRFRVWQVLGGRKWSLAFIRVSKIEFKEAE